MKKKTIVAVCAGAAVLVIGGGYGIFQLVKNNAEPVEVTPVSYLNQGYWGDSMPTSGYVTSDATQEVYLSDDELVDKVHVVEGDEVKIGDKLLSYDTTLLELDLESEQLARKSIRLQIEEAQRELEKLKKITPVPDGAFADASGERTKVLTERTAQVSAASVSTEPSQSETQPESESQSETQPQSESQSETQPQSESQSETQPQSESGTPEVTEPGTGESEESPLGEIKSYDELDYKSKPYTGEGTKEDPYIFFCKEGTTIYASFMNKMLGFNEAGTSRKKGGMKKDGKGCYTILEIREGDSVSGGFVKSIYINGTVKADKPYPPDITWTYGSDGVTKNVPEVDEPEPDEPDDPFEPGGWDDDVYTVTELKEAIKEKEDEIRDLKLDYRESKISVKQAKRKLDKATVKATINGVVKSVGDPALGSVDGEAFLTVASNQGMYVTGTISELKLGEVKVGTTMTGMSYESGSSFTAEITEISEYPGESDYWSSNEANASSYPFKAYIDDPGELKNNEYVDLTMEGSGEEDYSSAIYLAKAYIRSENGQSYVYKADENDRLVKHYIKTGATVYGTAVEIKGGLTEEDKIAFPYGKNVVEGAKTVEHDSDTPLY